MGFDLCSTVTVIQSGGAQPISNRNLFSGVGRGGAVGSGNFALTHSRTNRRRYVLSGWSPFAVTFGFWNVTPLQLRLISGHVELCQRHYAPDITAHDSDCPAVSSVDHHYGQRGNYSFQRCALGFTNCHALKEAMSWRHGLGRFVNGAFCR